MSKGSRRRPTDEKKYEEGYYRMKCNDTVYAVLAGEEKEIDNDPKLIELVKESLKPQDVTLEVTAIDGKSFRVMVKGKSND